jgi:pimeloyl-ACP methyl ester carboxylesterase
MSRARLVPFILETEKGGRRIAAELGHVSVPVRHARPDGPAWDLAFVRLPATTERPGPPTVLLAGGPGGSAIQYLRYEDDTWPGWPDFWSGLRSLGDVIALDQRGTGWSHPVPEAIERWDLPLDEQGDPETFHQVAAQRCTALRELWVDYGVDIGAYTTEESADDVDLLRQALGAEQIRLIGHSYGSHLGLSIIRRHGPSIDRAVLGIVEGPDHTHKLPSRVQAALVTLADMAAAASELRGRVPDLVGLAADLLQRLARRPERVEVAGAVVTVGPYDLQRAISDCMGDHASQAALPARLLRMASGDLGWLGEVTLERRRDWLSSVMYWHTDAASGASPERRRRIAEEAPRTLLGDVINHPFPRIETAWGSPDLGEAFRSQITSSVPVQFQSGALDGRTPPANVDDLIGGFSCSGHLVVDGIAHDEGFAVPEVRLTLLRFLGGADPVTIRAAAPFRFLPEEGSDVAADTRPPPGPQDDRPHAPG